jgi:hypothetical protein
MSGANALLATMAGEPRLWSAAELHRAFDARTTRTNVQQRLTVLRQRGLIRRRMLPAYIVTEEGMAALTNKGRPVRSGPRGTPAPRGFRARAWAAMRMFEGAWFSAGDVAELAAREEKAPLRLAEDYLKALRMGGYLLRTRSGGYRLVEDTGPRHPVVRAPQGTLYDPNTRTTVRMEG